ncbi:auxin efflux carrier transmembrane protein [Pholiota molesta]|nr:auxin efflux carrier transmembrane protein [Pholiota molesta]
MVAVGTLIWISCRPLLRLIFCVSCGIGITKADIFPAVAAAGAGQILLNITLPSLMFSKIVPAFTAQNVGALGPLVFIALLYEGIGMVMAFIIKQFFWVPHRFRYGILVAGGWGNVGDIPTAVIMSVAGAAPFRGVEDQNLAVAYISAFILVFMVTLFPLGGHRLVAWDFAGPDVEPEEVQEAMRIKRKAFFNTLPRIGRCSKTKYLVEQKDTTSSSVADVEEKAVSEENIERLMSMHQRHVSIMDDVSTMVPTEGVRSPMASSPPTEIGHQHRIELLDKASPQSVKMPKENTALPIHTPANQKASAPSTSAPRRLFGLKYIVNFLKAFLTPASIAIIVSFPIALIPKLKALFVPVPGVYMPAAPDGQPPLAFFLDATNFVGAASVPLGLVCLGSSLARLPFPRKGQWQMLPLGAISCVAVGRMVVMPVLGVVICQGLTKVGFIDKEDKVLQFVCIFLSCLPTATTQVLLTQVYSGTGSAEHLSPFLIPQYILMIFTMTALIAYSIQLLF